LSEASGLCPFASVISVCGPIERIRDEMEGASRPATSGSSGSGRLVGSIATVIRVQPATKTSRRTR
jgi:hypothetical protein